MTLPEHHLDDAVPAHRGDPFAEQRAMARTAAVVDRSHRGIIAVSGPDRLEWLHLLLTQHVSALPDGGATEALVLDGQGRVLHHMGVAHVGDVVYLDVEAAELTELLAYLEKMVFWSKVEPRDATADLALLSLVGPEAEVVLAAVGVPLPEGAAPLDGGGYIRRTPGPGIADLVVPRPTLGRVGGPPRRGGRAPGGDRRVRGAAGGGRAPPRGPRHRRPHHPARGRLDRPPPCTCRKAATAARRPSRGVANMGRPPRRLVLLHLDSGNERLPDPGEPVTHEGDRVVGRVGTVVQHHELGPVALALVKRSVPVDAELTAGTETPARIDPSSAHADDADAPGRAAQERLRRR